MSKVSYNIENWDKEVYYYSLEIIHKLDDKIIGPLVFMGLLRTVTKLNKLTILLPMRLANKTKILKRVRAIVGLITHITLNILLLLGLNRLVNNDLATTTGVSLKVMGIVVLGCFYYATQIFITTMYFKDVKKLEEDIYNDR